jgi:uncharacterized membrane protein/glutaredoxin
MLNVTLYSRPDCHLCKQTETDLIELKKSFEFNLVVIDIESDRALQETFALEIPVVEAGPFRLKAPISKQELKIAVGAALDRLSQLERINDKAYLSRAAQGQVITRADRISLWTSKHYLLLINLLLFLYFGIPILAPVFKEAGLNIPAEVIYRIYRPLCHQWSFRSWFLFGKQAYYPHAAAGIANVLTFEEATGITDLTDPSRTEARLFEGNEYLGYKIALCQRDEAIWGSMFLFGIIYSLSGRRIKKLHWILWIVIGLIPVGLDGFSQLFSQLPGNFIHSILPYRESTPLLRTLTGFLFGWTTAWFTIPLIEETMEESRRALVKKFVILKS